MIAGTQHEGGVRTRQATRPYCGTVDMARCCKQDTGLLATEIVRQRQYARERLKAAVITDYRQVEERGLKCYKPHTGRHRRRERALGLDDHKVDAIPARCKPIRKGHSLAWSPAASQAGNKERDGALCDRLGTGPQHLTGSFPCIVRHRHTNRRPTLGATRAIRITNLRSATEYPFCY